MEEIQTLNKTKIEDLNHSIDNGLRVASVFLTIWSGILFLQFVFAIIATFFGSNLDVLFWDNQVSFWFRYISLLSINISNTVVVFILRKKDRIDFARNRFTCIFLIVVSSLFIACLLIVFIISVVYITLGSIHGEEAIINGALIMDFFYLFCFIGYLSLLVSCCKVIKKYKIEYADDIKRYEEHQQQLAYQQAIEKQQAKDLNSVNYLLSKVGNKFFVKYYFELRDWTEPDILDIIEEDYTEETKTQRIREAKKIFEQRLNKLALQRISDIKNISVGEETRQKAKELLEKII